MVWKQKHFHQMNIRYSNPTPMLNQQSIGCFFPLLEAQGAWTGANGEHQRIDPEKTTDKKIQQQKQAANQMQTFKPSKYFIELGHLLEISSCGSHYESSHCPAFFLLWLVCFLLFKYCKIVFAVWFLYFSFIMLFFVLAVFGLQTVRWTRVSLCIINI